MPPLIGVFARKCLASLFEGGVSPYGLTEGVTHRFVYTPPVTFGDSPLREGAKAF